MHGNMVKFTLKVVVVVTVVACAAGVFAQPPGPSEGLPEGGSGGPRDGFRPPPDPLRQALDANHDHQIDADEIKNASAAILTLDADGDGMLGREELRPPMPPEMQGRGGRGFDRGQRRGGPGEGGPGPGGARRPGGREGPDAGGPAAGGPRGPGGGQGPSPDRFIERAMRFDADGDGRLSRDELQAFAAEMMQRRGGPGGPPGGEGPGGGERPPRPSRPEE